MERRFVQSVSIEDELGGQRRHTKYMKEEQRRLGITDDYQDRNQFRERLFDIKIFKEEKRECGGRG